MIGGAPQSEGVPFLWIDPPASRPGRQVQRLIGWDGTHPTLRFLELSDLVVEAGPYPRPPGARVLAETGAGPLILQRTFGSRRGVVWAFDPARSDLPLRVAFPILVLNTLEHLAPEAGALPGALPTGRAQTVDWPTAQATLEGPGGERVELQARGGRIDLPPLERPGAWSLTDGDARRTFAAALLSDADVDLRRAGETAVELDGSAARPDLVRRAGISLRESWRWLAGLALLLLALEGVAFSRRWGR